MLSVWIRAVTRPRLATYEALLEEAEDPSLGRAVKAILVAALIVGTVLVFVELATGRMTLHHLDSPVAVAMVAYIYVVIAVLLIIAFLIDMSILLAVSKALGGQETLATQSYLLSASAAPMLVLALPVLMIAGWSSLLRWPVILYGRYLELLGLRAAHKYGWGRGVVALVVLTLCWVVVGKCLEIAFGPLT